MHKIVTLDPGITTGYTLAAICDKFYIACEEAILSHRQLFELLLKSQPNTVVCESFEYRNTKSKDNVELYPRELIGIARLYCEMYPMTKLYMQTPAQGKGFYTDDKLRKLGIYKKGCHHGRDAVRHLMHWYTFGAGFQFNTKQPLLLTTEEKVHNEFGA